MVRHTSHRDVFAEVLAAFCQCDAERFAGLDGILEEQLVKVSHSVKQKAVRVRGLDLCVLGHHWRHAGGLRPGARRTFRCRARLRLDVWALRHVSSRCGVPDNGVLCHRNLRTGWSHLQ